jgi:hypothetical protein
MSSEAKIVPNLSGVTRFGVAWSVLHFGVNIARSFTFLFEDVKTDLALLHNQRLADRDEWGDAIDFADSVLADLDCFEDELEE